MFVYLITNLVNLKYYVGRTKRKNIFDRWYEHIKCSPEEGFQLHRAIHKYGPNSFCIEILAVCSSLKELANTEQLWILSLRSYDREIGYNLTLGGEGYGVLEAEKRKEINRKIADKTRGRKKQKPVWNKGKKNIETLGEERAAEISRSISQRRTGKRDSYETLQRKSNARKEYLASNPGVMSFPRGPCKESTKIKIGAANSVSMKELWQDENYRKMQSEVHKKHRYIE